MSEETGVVLYYIDQEKADKKSVELNTEIMIPPPTIKTEGVFGDAGIDLYAAYRFVVPSNERKVVDTFIGFSFTPGIAGLLWPRGGDDFLLGAGVIDTGYTGTVKCMIINPYKYNMVFVIGDSVGQLVLFRKPFVYSPTLQLIHKSNIESKTDSKRGEDGRINNQV